MIEFPFAFKYIEIYCEIKSLLMMRILTACTVCILCGMSGSAWAQSPLVPLDHWSYRIFDRFVTQGGITQLPYHSYPWQREEGASLLTELQRQKSDLHLSRNEKALLRRLYQEWSDKACQDALGKKEFGNLMRQKGYSQKKSGGVRYWTGITITIKKKKV